VQYGLTPYCTLPRVLSLSATHDQDSATTEAVAVTTAAKAGEPDRYLAALLAAPRESEALLALAAFSAELARIPRLVVREPLMGGIRLQWWRDVLALADGERTGHAVADAVRQAVRSFTLPAALLDGMIEAQPLALESAPFADDAALDDFLWRTEGAQFALAARVVGLPASDDVDAACRFSGQAYGAARLLLSLPRSLSLGRVPLSQAQMAQAGVGAHELLAGVGGAEVAALLAACRARIGENLAAARRFVQQLPRPTRIAFLPLALVGPYLRALERAGDNPLRREARIAPLARVWRITVAHLFGRL
jgi:15-cis-phytoene synthase